MGSIYGGVTGITEAAGMGAMVSAGPADSAIATDPIEHGAQFLDRRGADSAADHQHLAHVLRQLPGQQIIDMRRID